MDFCSFIVKNLTRRPVRTALTVLGLSVAVGSMIALLGVSHNVEATVSEGFERRGVDLVVIQGGVTDQLSSDIDEKLAHKVLQVPGVDPSGVDIALIQMLELRRPSGSSIPAMCVGWPAANFGFDDLTFLSGRRLHEGEHRQVLLGATLAGNLHKSVGQTVEIQEQKFEIVGIYKSFSVFENGSIIMLLPAAQKLTGREGRITGFSLRVVKSIEHPDADVEAVRLLIDKLTDDTGKHLLAQTTKDYVSTAWHITLIRALVWMISVIALVIGVISMLNTMIMSVMERTQEIGILRAVGWPRSRVVRMVMGEAVALGLAAATLGSLGAWVMTYVLTLFPRVNGFIESGIAPVVFAQGYALTMLIGLLGAAYPAFRAAQLLPTEALRHD